MVRIKINGKIFLQSNYPKKELTDFLFWFAFFKNIRFWVDFRVIIRHITTFKDNLSIHNMHDWSSGLNLHFSDTSIPQNSISLKRKTASFFYGCKYIFFSKIYHITNVLLGYICHQNGAKNIQKISILTLEKQN